MGIGHPTDLRCGAHWTERGSGEPQANVRWGDQSGRDWDRRGKGERFVKRDMGLIRKLVLTIEKRHCYAPQVAIEGYSEEVIGYQSHLMIEAGQATGVDVSAWGVRSPEAVLRSLTWEGHESLRLHGDETRWRRAMGVVKEQGGSVTLSVLTSC